MSESEIDQAIAGMFYDPTMVSENAGVEIINASGVFGVGNSLARIISNIGGHVIVVRNSSKTEKKSSITYTGEKGYTLSRISKLTGVTPELYSKDQLADITFTIGKDASLVGLLGQ